ncbi:MAG: hypothetical protein EOP45_08020 [Sphingobacteriaceae bacterium]|nr:MAG: hypothetical protein EOP45_08020 [Sphingobacteriaceae bacterium]
MKKTYYLLLFVVLLPAAVRAQTGWITKKLDEKVSVKFPAEPQKVSKSGIDTYTFKAKDSTGYNTAVIDYQVVAHLDSATLAPMKDSQEFADQMKMGIASKKPNYTFGEVTIGKWKTYTTYQFSGTENTTKNTVSVQMILIGSKMYVLTCLVPSGLTTPNKEVFLSSAELLNRG